jgi:citrate lyase beta subunit
MDWLVDRVDAMLAGDDAEPPSPVPGRQPVHTVYVPADRFDAGTLRAWGGTALSTMDEHGPLPDLDEALVRAKLAREPIEDLRIDFEDGYGVRPDDEEDRAARAAAVGLHEAPPAFSGIRIKSFEAPTRRRALRTLDIFLDAATPPNGFRVTLPKVSSVRQVDAMLTVCDHYDLRFEMQVETPQAILGTDGTATVARMLSAAAPRCAGLHYGTYDYSTALGIAPAQQSMDHPAADHAKAVMQVAAATAGVPVSDGSTNVLPVGDTAAVRTAWALHARLVRRSLERGFYRGWDLHPAQLPTRFAATYAFYRDGLPAATARLHAYLDREAGGPPTATADEPATARALARYLLRAQDCGAVGSIYGLAAEELRAVSGS